MIRIYVKKEKNVLKEIIIKGHADYDEYGKDIVCAAVSATYLCTINGIFALQENGIELQEEKNIRTIKVIKENQTIITLLENMIRCLENLEKQYPKNIKLIKEEK